MAGRFAFDRGSVIDKPLPAGTWAAAALPLLLKGNIRSEISGRVERSCGGCY